MTKITNKKGLSKSQRDCHVAVVIAPRNDVSLGIFPASPCQGEVLRKLSEGWGFTALEIASDVGLYPRYQSCGVRGHGSRRLIILPVLRQEYNQHQFS